MDPSASSSGSIGGGGSGVQEGGGVGGEDLFYLALSPDPIRFEPVSKVTNIFYDDANQQVFAVRSGGATGVVVKGRGDKGNCSFRMEDKGPVQSIKLSPDQRILSVQRSNQSVEFINFGALSSTSPSSSSSSVPSSASTPSEEYSQTCKNKNGTILGFVWISNNEILFITKLGLELFQVFPEKRMLKYTKNISITIDWYLHSPESNVLVVSSSGGVIQPFQLRPGNIHKFPKLDIDPSSPQKCSERDVSIASLYGQTAVLILRHKSKSSTCIGAEIDVYVLNKEKTTPKSHVLRLETSGRFAINVIDNLIIVHHQASKSSIVFDVRLSGGYDGYATYQQPIVVPMPITPFKLKLPTPTAAPSVSGDNRGEIDCELYSVNWVVFQPNVIIDARLGCLWFLELRLDSIKNLMHDRIRLVEFFLQRRNGKKFILQVINDCITTSPLELPVLSGVFDKLNENYRSFQDIDVQRQMALPVNLGRGSGGGNLSTPKGVVLLEQKDLYDNIFSEFVQESFPHLTDQMVIIILTEYIRSLSHFGITVKHYIYELVIYAMVRQKTFYQLHQFLQYHVFSDSKELAYRLLSLEGVYPAAYQLALDMLRRLQIANESILEILLNKCKVIPALRFVQSCERTDNINARKYLEAAMKTKDKSVFYAVFKFFEERNIKVKGTPVFEPGEMCEPYVNHFTSLFGRSSACSNFVADGNSQ